MLKLIFTIQAFVILSYLQSLALCTLQFTSYVFVEAIGISTLIQVGTRISATNETYSLL